MYFKTNKKNMSPYAFLCEILGYKNQTIQFYHKGTLLLR